jgi:hypothetical protein
LPSRVSLHEPEFWHAGHCWHDVPKKFGAHTSHTAPAHPWSHEQMPTLFGSPCVEHVDARENWHAAPTKPLSHEHEPS